MVFFFAECDYYTAHKIFKNIEELQTYDSKLIEENINLLEVSLCVVLLFLKFEFETIIEFKKIIILLAFK